MKKSSIFSPLCGMFLLFMAGFSLCGFSQTYSVSAPGANGKYGVVNEKGAMIIPQEYASVVVLPEGNFVVWEENPGWPMIINQNKQILVGKKHYFARALDAFKDHFICQYYKEGKMAELFLIKANDSIIYTFPPNYLSAEFIKDSCYTYIKAQTDRPGELLSLTLKGQTLCSSESPDFNWIKGMLKPCNGYAIAMKKSSNGDYSAGVYDVLNKKMIIPCTFDNIEYDNKTGLIKTYHKVYTTTYDLYNMQGKLEKSWNQIKK